MVDRKAEGQSLLVHTSENFNPPPGRQSTRALTYSISLIFRLTLAGSLSIVCIQMTSKGNPLVLKIDTASDMPVYRQIVDGLRAMLVAGVFAPGDKFPTVRQLAIDLAVNHNTVAEAYRLLATEGWLELKRHHGARVILRGRQTAKPATRAVFLRRLRELAALAVADGMERRAISEQLNTIADEINSPAKATS
jgi:GntR family transcriptional regulator